MGWSGAAIVCDDRLEGYPEHDTDREWVLSNCYRWHLWKLLIEMEEPGTALKRWIYRAAG
jgi:hypothetical protein